MLVGWLLEHAEYPFVLRCTAARAPTMRRYPSKEDKAALCRRAGVTPLQVCASLVARGCAA